jgi:hypothetical protein
MNTSVRLGRRTASPQEKPFGPRWLRIAFWFCTAIAVAAVLRRLFALAHPPQSGPPQLVAVEADFASHAALTLAHILPALAVCVARAIGLHAAIRGCFATSRLTHLEPRQFFGVAFWIGFSINTVAVELWLRSRHGQSQIASS